MNAYVPNQTEPISLLEIKEVSQQTRGEIERYVKYQEHDRNPTFEYNEQTKELRIIFARPFPANEPTLDLLSTDIENIKELHTT